ncbi:hypothetical protein [Bradyrhizobium yuanmingense]|uniref:hypothetical protein n=1 Tax=Bradyrhizobium yuanmingense TaxID=108015 RepID=UPI0012FD974C|nr:hypothetical protein [Bradyrhizobium yuanmingense]
MNTYREMAAEADQSRIAILHERNADLRKQLDDAHAQLFANNFWLLVIGIAIGVVATLLVGGAK